MSTLKEKKAELLAKLAKQRAKQKEEIFTIPTVKLSDKEEKQLSAKEKKEKAKKTFIPSSKILADRSKADDKMREFIGNLKNLTDKDFDMSSGYTKSFISAGYNLFVGSYIKDAIKQADDPNTNRKEIEEEAINEWMNMPMFSKKIWLLKGYGEEKNAEFGRKKFAEDIENYAFSEQLLDNIFSLYLDGDIKYNEFISTWRASLSKETKEDMEKKVEGDVSQNV